MQVAIDKTCLKYLDKVKGNELIYIFDDEPLEELLKLNMHCVHKSKINEYDNYKDFFICDNKTWCTAWCRVIRKDKIVYFPESTLMEDRTWAYEQADNVSLENVRNLKEVCYVWNRLNTTNSVSLARGKMWEASAWKHIGEQYMLLERLKHKEMIPVLEERIKQCIIKVNLKEYQQY